MPLLSDAEPGNVEVTRCYMRIRNFDSKQLFEIGYQFGNDTVFAELPPGTYTYKSTGKISFSLYL